ncbi:MAG: peptidoglycan-binding protein [Candidatus Pacebacteria bacterium]|jgi:peptidoglycan hydrolase-like protein with peptidoglycan-binding domain|nr:peptidoglycan-binding protein [Candidatus Paceibacterota bacterium]
MNQKIKAMIFIAIALAFPFAGRAQTSADILAQIRALQAQLNALIAQLGGAATAPAPAAPPACGGILFSRNLTLGMTGNDVRCLQAFLNQSADTILAVAGAGSPGAETFYFGPLTRAAVIRFQSKYLSSIITLSGFSDVSGVVGTATRAQLNNLLLAPAIPTAPTTPTTPGTGSTVGGIVINGREGALTVSVNPTPINGTRVYEGNSKVAVMGIQLRATNSDLSVQRLALGFNERPQNYFSAVYIYEGNTLIDSVNLNDSTVSRVTSSRYVVYLTDFNNPVVVREGTTRTITVRVDVQSGISSGLLTDSSTNVNLFAIANGIRAMDQAGLNIFAPGNDNVVARTVNVNRSLSASATLTIGNDPNTPAVGNLVADSSNMISETTILVFDVNARNDNLLIGDINNVRFATGTGFLVPQTVYLFDDNGALIASATPNQQTGIANFNNMNVEIGAGTTRKFMIKIDDTLASDGSDNGKTYRVSLQTDDGSTAYFVVERSNGSLLPVGDMSGSAQSFDQFALQSGPVFNFMNVSTSQIPRSSFAPSTISAAFTIQVTARGGDVYMPLTGAFRVAAVRNNDPDTAAAVSSVVYQIANAARQTNSYRISQNTTATFTVNASWPLAGASGAYNLQIDRIDWGLSDASPATQAATYMDNFVSGFEFLQ